MCKLPPLVPMPIRCSRVLTSEGFPPSRDGLTVFSFFNCVKTALSSPEAVQGWHGDDYQ